MDTLFAALGSIWAVTTEMAPYLLFGFIAAGVLSQYLSARWVGAHLGGTGVRPVALASLLGVPLPLCSCSVIPVSAGLREQGAGKGATTAFLLSTPQTGAESIAVTWALLGPVFAVFRVGVAFVSGLLAGLAVDLFAGDATPTEQPQPDGCEHNPNQTDVPAAAASCCHEAPETTPEPECHRDGTAPEKPPGKLRAALRYGFDTLAADLAPTLLVGILIAGLIPALLPESALAPYLSHPWGGYLAMLLMGIPLYVCSTASIPIASALWLHQGASPGAALVFLIAGPATNAATLSVLWNRLGHRACGLYLASAALTALAAGWTLDQLIAPETHPLLNAHDHASPVWSGFQWTSALLLCALLGYHILKKYWPTGGAKHSCCDSKHGK